MANPPSRPACAMLGHDLDRDVRQACDAGEVRELRGHGFGGSNAAA